MNPIPSNAVFTGPRPSIAQRQTPRDTQLDTQLDTLQTQPFSKKRSADARAVMHKAGQQHARWHNPFIAHAMPAVLSVQRHLADQSLNQPEARLQLVQELRLCRERLAQAGLDSGQISDASYLLCTYLDEVVSDFARQRAQTPYLEEPSLLVEFHGDAWGGEDAFTNLEHWIAQDPAPLWLLGFYALVLSLGWQGRYRVRDRGEVLLLDLRAQLHAVVWGQAGPPALGSDLIHPAPAKQTGWSWRQKITGVTLVALVLYGLANLMLDLYGRPIRAALAAWEPPIRTINLAQQLPPPLPELLGEGWLSAYKHPQGWLLVFKSDGAFGVGKAEFTPQFVNNIERLAQALAPWPGDLEVIGHTDTQPIKFSHFPSNLELSKARAQTAAQVLRNYASKGGANAADNTVARAITASGRGDTEPVDSNRTPLAFEKNRRVDVLWKVAPGLHSPNHTHTLGNPNPAAPALSNAP